MLISPSDRALEHTPPDDTNWQKILYLHPSPPPLPVMMERLFHLAITRLSLQRDQAAATSACLRSVSPHYYHHSWAELAIKRPEAATWYSMVWAMLSSPPLSSVWARLAHKHLTASSWLWIFSERLYYVKLCIVFLYIWWRGWRRLRCEDWWLPFPPFTPR